MAQVIEGTLEAWQTDDGELVVRDPEADDEKPEDAERLSLDIGIAFPDGFIADVATGDEDVTVTVYSDANVPAEIQGAMTSFVREAAYAFAGRRAAGHDAGRGDDRPRRGPRRRPGLHARQDASRCSSSWCLLMETFSMSSLVSTEVLQRTVTAVLVTPAKVCDFLAAKTIFGTFMSLGQGLIILLLVGGLTTRTGRWCSRCCSWAR